MNAFQLYFRLIQISLLSRMQYRANFVAGILGLIFWNVINLGLIGVLVTRFSNLKSWTVWELVFLYCLWIMGHSLYSLFFSHTTRMEDYLVAGTFDQFLMRPASPIVQFLGRELQYIEIADALIGLTGISLAYTQLNLHWDSLKWGFFLLAIISGAVIELSINLLIACSAFWTGRSRSSFILVHQFYELVHKYPIDIFGLAFRVIVTGIIPVAFMNYYPALFLLDKVNPTRPGWWLSYVSPLVALLLVGIDSVVWHRALNRYSSTGS
jgi:viologen exporter family transport system permease protein